MSVLCRDTGTGNRRDTVEIEAFREQCAVIAVVDIDILWRHQETHKDFHWKRPYL